MKFYVNVASVDTDRKVGYGHDPGDVDEYEAGSLGELFRDLQREFGRCIGKMYVDQIGGDTIQTGWVFEKREQYTCGSGSFLAQHWITVLSERPKLAAAVYAFG